MEAVENDAIKERLRNLCVDTTRELSRLGLAEFSFLIKSRKFNFCVDINGESGTHKTKSKKKSPSSLRRSRIRKQLFLQKKFGRNASTPIVSSLPAENLPGASSLNSEIRCDNCDKPFMSSKSLAIHQAKQHGGKIAQIDGQSDQCDVDNEVVFDSSIFDSSILLKRMDGMFDELHQGVVSDLESSLDNVMESFRKNLATPRKGRPAHGRDPHYRVRRDSNDETRDLENDNFFTQSMVKVRYNF